MARKFINRTDEVIPKDELSYIAKLGPKTEIKDVLDVEDRYITFEKQQRHKVKPKKTSYEATREGIRYALDAAGNTGQYIKYVNYTIDKQQAQIDKVKKLQEKFEEEISMLQSHKLQKIDFDYSSIENFDDGTISDFLNQLLLENRITKSKLKNLKNQAVSVEDKFKVQEKQIQNVRKHLRAKQLADEKYHDNLDELKAIQTIRNELSSLGEDHNITKLSKAIEKFISSTEPRI